MGESNLIISELFSRFPGIRFGMSTRLDGASPEPFGMNLSFHVGDDEKNVVENRRRFFGALGIDYQKIAFPRQIHSDTLQVVSQPGEYPACDGLMTDSGGVPLVVTIADCVPIALYEPTKNVIALIHAGWRGTAQAIVAKAVDMMVEKFGLSAGEIVAFLGPSAGSCCYEIGSDVAESFSEVHLEHRGNKMFLDLKRANLDQLLGNGLQAHNIEVSEFCTICNPTLFHSHRRDKTSSGRMMAVLSLEAKSKAA